MSAMASQITSLAIVYSTVYSGTDDRKQQTPRHWTFYEENSPVTGNFPAQRASNAENVSNWWRHHSKIHVMNISTLSLSYPLWDLHIERVSRDGSSENTFIALANYY